MAPIRAAIDTNVAISAARAGGVPGEVAQMWRAGEIVLCVSRPIVAEYRRVFAKFGLSAEFAEIERAINARRHCEMAETTPSLRVVSDPDDDMFVECAVALNAQFIVSGDRALQNLRRYRGVNILSPAEFVEVVRGEKSA